MKIIANTMAPLACMHACTKKIGISESDIYDYSNDALKMNQDG